MIVSLGGQNYIVFKYYQVKEDHPTMSVTDVAKELGRRWSELDSESKQRFHARYSLTELVLSLKVHC